MAMAAVTLDDIRFSSYRTAAKVRQLQKDTLLHQVDIWHMIEVFRTNDLHSGPAAAAAAAAAAATSPRQPLASGATNGVVDPPSLLSESRLQAILQALYHDLHKRLPPPPPPPSAAGFGGPEETDHGRTLDRAMDTLWHFLQSTGQSDGLGALTVRSLKTILATLSTGKLMDKLRYLFSQLSDDQGHLIHERFRQFVRDVRQIPRALHEPVGPGGKRRRPRRPRARPGQRPLHGEGQAPGQGEDDEEDDCDDRPHNDDEEDEDGEEPELIFESGRQVSVNDFLETLMSDPGPQCLSWLLILHRLINSESVYHGVTCGYCRARGFYGLRYKSERTNYHLCQNCFWRGQIGPDHVNDVFKEFNYFKTSSSSSASAKSSSSTSSSSFKRNLPCLAPQQEKRSEPMLPQWEPEHPLDLSNMIPDMNGSLSSVRLKEQPRRRDAMQNAPRAMMQQQQQQQQQPMFEDEHSMIAHYAHCLHDNDSGEMVRGRAGPLTHSRQIVQDLERRNKEILQDINQLRQTHQFQHGGDSGGGGGGGGGGDGNSGNNPKLMSELTHLRSYKGQLEGRLGELQETRKELMHELEALMTLLQTQKISPSSAQRM